jgi:hypothetical protein
MEEDTTTTSKLSKLSIKVDQHGLSTQQKLRQGRNSMMVLFEVVLAL